MGWDILWIHDGVIMSSPLSLGVPNFYMEKYVKTVIESALLKSKYWFRYMDDLCDLERERERPL